MITKHQLTQQRQLAATYPNRNLTFVRGEGTELITANGERYLDLMSNMGVNLLGYAHKTIEVALKEQLNQLTTLHSSFNSDVRSQAITTLLSRVQKHCGNINRVYWANSGTEAVEAALKFAMLHTGRSRFICAQNSFHGKTLGSLSMTTAGNNKYQQPFAEALHQTDTVEFGNINSLKKTITDQYAAVILEPIQGEGGIHIPPENYLQEVQAICEQHGVLLIVDEIQSGLGRTGVFLNTSVGDIVCLGKGLASGIPIGATLITETINESLINGVHTSTFGGNPLAMRGVLATLAEITPMLLSHTQQVGSYFLANLEKLKRTYPNHIAAVSGRGLMLALEVNTNPMPLLKFLQNNHILSAPTSTNRIRFLPPLIISTKQITKVTAVLINYFTNYV